MAWLRGAARQHHACVAVAPFARAFTFAHASCSLTGARAGHGSAATAGLAMVSVVFVQFFASWHVPSVLSAGRRLSLRLHPRPAIAVAPLLLRRRPCSASRGPFTCMWRKGYGARKHNASRALWVPTRSDMQSLKTTTSAALNNSFQVALGTPRHCANTAVPAVSNAGRMRRGAPALRGAS